MFMHFLHCLVFEGLSKTSVLQARQRVVGGQTMDGVDS